MMISSRIRLSFTYPPNQLGLITPFTLFNGSDRLNVPDRTPRQPALHRGIACLRAPSSRRKAGAVETRPASADERSRAPLRRGVLRSVDGDSATKASPRT